MTCKTLTRIIGASMSAMMSTLAAANPTYTVPSVITNLEPRETAVDIYLPQADNPMGCSTSGWFRLNTNASNYASIYAIVLTQFARGGNIELYANGCDGDGTSLIVAAWAT